MQIDRTNYESYFLDYIEGNLSVELIDQFLDFLERNQDLKDELQLVLTTPVVLPDKHIIFEDKKSLLKDVRTGASSFDYQVIAFLEGDLSKEEEIWFERELLDDARKQESFNVIKTLKLRPQQDILFPHKVLLLKESRRKSLRLWAVPAAAFLILGFLFAIPFFENHKETVSPRKVAEVAPSDPPVERQTRSLPAGSKESAPNVAGKKQVANAAPSKPAGKTPVKQTGPEQQENASVVTRQEEPIAALQPIETGILHVAAAETKRLLSKEHHAPDHAEEYTRLTDYLAEKLLDVPKDEPITLAGIATVGLQVAEDISHNKFNIEKGEKGHVKEISFNSALFGFSIPIKKNR